MQTNSEKQAILDALSKWIRQRPGLDFANYGDIKNYRAESRSITRDLHDARTLLRAVELAEGLDADTLTSAFSAFSGRLTCKISDDGTVTLDYCTGQYWPTEYRKAACAVLASALWSYYRTDVTNDTVNGQSPGDRIRKQFRNLFGARMQKRWFD